MCGAAGKKCNVEHLQLLNACDTLQKQFGCKVCKKSVGAEQPVYVTPEAAKEFSPGDCLVNALPEHSTCASSHHATIRLCACS